MVYKIQIRTLIEVSYALQKIQTELTGLDKVLIDRSEIYICIINDKNLESDKSLILNSGMDRHVSLSISFSLSHRSQNF